MIFDDFDTIKSVACQLEVTNTQISVFKYLVRKIFDKIFVI